MIQDHLCHLLESIVVQLVYDMAYCRFVLRGQTSDYKLIEKQLILTDEKYDLE